jgi:aspartate aminotransferase-like enzyme
LRKQLLMIPGPTPCPDAVLRALSTQMINHRGPEYMALQRELIAGLQEVFQTRSDCLIFPASGTGGLEAAVVNTLSPGDRVLAVVIGAFGDRFAQIAAAHGADVQRLDVEWGQAVDPQQVAEILRRDRDRVIRAVLITHNETSTGVVNDIRAVAGSVREHGALLMVDSISGMLTAELETDAWGLDMVVAGSQKAFMIPPGLTFVSVSPRAWEAHRTARMGRYYFDFTLMRRSMEKGQTPYTPALPQLFALKEALALIRQEGRESMVARHRRLARACRAGAAALGLQPLADERSFSHSVTAIRNPPGIEGKVLRQRLRERHGVVVAGGQGPLAEAIFRVGHLGYVDSTDLTATFAALEESLAALEHSVQPGAGVAAVERTLSDEADASSPK